MKKDYEQLIKRKIELIKADLDLGKTDELDKLLRHVDVDVLKRFLPKEEQFEYEEV